MKLSLEPIIITKELILSKIPEEQIMEHYLGVPIQKGLFKSPLRNDKRPTCSYYRNRRGRLIMKDFSGAFSGDCFSVVQEKFQCSYYMALQIVANDFGLIHRNDLKINKPKIEYSGIKIEERQAAKIQIQTREFNNRELAWWMRYGINKKTLKLFHVYPVDKVWLNDHLFYQNLDNKFVFGYYGGIKNGLEQWRIYWPNNRSLKFISNWKGTQIQGAHMLPKNSNFIVITKSLKDVMCLYEFGIPAIAPCSENLFVTESQYTKLKEYYKNIFLLYDLDSPGIKAAKKIKKLFPDVIVLLTPRELGYKDFSDLRKGLGYKATMKLVEDAKNYYL